MTKAFATVLTIAVLALNSANAAIVFGNLGATGTGAIGTSGGVTLTSSQWRAVGFTAGGLNLVLDTATIGLSVNANGPATVRLDLYTRVSGVPGTSLFNTTETLTANFNGPVTFNLNQTLISGTSYYIVASKVSGAGTLSWRPGVVTGAPTAQNGSGWANLANVTGTTTANSGATWGSTGNASQSAISLSASPIPEPGTWAAMAIFAGGAAYAGWRRRQQLA